MLTDMHHARTLSVMNNDTNRLQGKIHCDECERSIDAGEPVSRLQNDGMKTYCTDCKPIPEDHVLFRRSNQAPTITKRIRACENCTRPTFVTSIYTKYCSGKCSRQYNNARLAESRKFSRAMLNGVGKECQQCGDKFTPPRSDAKFCSPACKQLAYRERKS